MSVDLKKLHRRLYEEAWGKGNLAVFDEVCDPTYEQQDPFTGGGDLQEAKDLCRMYRAAFPDLKPTILGQIVEGESCFTHWRMTGTHEKSLLGIEPTGKRCTVEGFSLGRFRGGKLVESFVQWDALGLLRQLGVAPGIGAMPLSSDTDTRPHA